MKLFARRLQGMAQVNRQGRSCSLRPLHRLAVLLGLGVGFALGASFTARAESYAELDVRAVYLYNFAAFVDWPDRAFESSTSPVRYCVLANRALQANLRQVLDGERVDGRPFELLTDENPQRWSRCHLLYVDHGYQALAKRVLRQAKGRPVLTVSDAETFLYEGGAMALVRKSGRLRPFVNRSAVAAAGIRISSKLLRIATLVEP
ncbi:YfiR family protein [Thiorhodococcus minor]|uniref:YfiR family protein n=1 Tax=Thiorhodococcus minor TaxID=57489 RepID=A0A6M0JZF1_9GAMM|nr:YfiR family protein [Thiorhodococcus minor]NEV62441.1 YfiR family protein [Thiorhodococcus minor]